MQNMMNNITMESENNHQKENFRVEQKNGTKRAATRSHMGGLLLEKNSNIPLNGYYPSINLPLVTYGSGGKVINNIDAKKNLSHTTLYDLSQQKSSFCATDQNSFMRCLELQPTKDRDSASGFSVNDYTVAPRISQAIIKEVEFSSNIGIVLASRLSKNGAGLESSYSAEYVVSRYELYCRSMRISRNPATFPVAYKCQYGDEPPSKYRYCFNRNQRLERRRILKCGLSRKSRLLIKRCKRCSVCVPRLSQAFIKAKIGGNDVTKTNVIHETSLRLNASDDGDVVIWLDASNNYSFATASKPLTSCYPTFTLRKLLHLDGRPTTTAASPFPKVDTTDEETNLCSYALDDHNELYILKKLPSAGLLQCFETTSDISIPKPSFQRCESAEDSGNGSSDCEDICPHNRKSLACVTSEISDALCRASIANLSRSTEICSRCTSAPCLAKNCLGHATMSYPMRECYVSLDRRGIANEALTNTIVPTFITKHNGLHYDDHRYSSLYFAQEVEL